MFRKILAGTDGSDSATLALAHAADLAEKLGAELVVATAHEREGSTAADTDAGVARALLRDVEAAYGGRIPLTTKAGPGAAAEVLVEMAEQEGCDLLVVGNRGLPRTSMLQAPSVPGRVSRRALVAVLVVDTMGKRPPGYDRILAAADGPSSAAVEAAVDLAGRLESELGLAAMASSDREGRKLVEELQARWPEAMVHAVPGGASEGLSDLAESDRYDLVVLGNRGMTGVRRALGSVPSRVLRRAPASVLLINTTG